MSGIYDLRVDVDRIEHFESIEDKGMIEEYKNLITEHAKTLVHENESDESLEIKTFISKEIFTKMPDQSAAHVLREILFTNKNNVIDWNAAKSVILDSMPEIRNL